VVDTSQSMRDYVENFRANLPAGITYDPILSRYFCNDRRFLNEWEVERYLNYINKFGFTSFPSSLFANGEEGAWFDPSDLTTMFTDTAGTTQATVGDPVALIQDKSGNDWHLTQSTASKRPVLREDSGLYYLEFDGVDDFIGEEDYNFGGPDNVEVFVAGEYFQTAGATIVSFGGNNSSAYFISHPDGFSDAEARVRFNSGNNYAIGETPIPAAPHKSVIYAASESDTALVWARVNGVQYLTANNDTRTSGWDRDQRMLLGTFRTSSGFYSGKFYGAITRGGTRSTDETVQAVEQYLADKSGTTL